jgi:dTDP-glucose 4,6-dehydratase
VTGGSGFIGSNFVRHVLATHPEDRIVNLDKLTYAGNPANLADLERDPRYAFVRGDICDAKLVRDAARGVDAIVNFAACTHVDRSLMEPDEFLRTDVFGVFTLLEAVKELKIPRLLHISTDEVYGSVERGSSREIDPLRPSNPYSASKAAGDLLALAYWQTHRLPVLITRSSNNFGSNQYPEKVIPLFVTNALDDQPLPLYGDGKNVRDWLYVLDNCAAIDLVLRKGGEGEVYNIGGGHEVENVVLTRQILRLTGKPESLIKPVKDRPGHDRRYSVDSKKVRQLGWAPRHRFPDALATTVAWYREHESWWRPLKSGEFRAYYEKQYGHR